MADAVKKKPRSFTKRKIVIEKKISKEKSSKIKSPKNNRTFAESKSFIQYVDTPVLVSFLSGIVILGIILTGIVLQQDIKLQAKTIAQQKQMVGELSYWKQIVAKYSDYRDAYLRESALAQALGDMKLSESAREKAAELDPNY